MTDLWTNDERFLFYFLPSNKSVLLLRPRVMESIVSLWHHHLQMNEQHMNKRKRHPCTGETAGGRTNPMACYHHRFGWQWGWVGVRGVCMFGVLEEEGGGACVKGDGRKFLVVCVWPCLHLTHHQVPTIIGQPQQKWNQVSYYQRHATGTVL